MKTTRNKIIKNKVFTKKDILNLWDIVKKEYDDSKSTAAHSSLELEIKCIDGISYESETNDLLQDGDIIDVKRCSDVNIEYHDYKQERRIRIFLSHGGSYRNGFMVRGDKNWVSGTFDSLNDLIESAKPQEHWFIKYNPIFLHVGAVFFGLMVYKLLDLILYQHIQPIKNPSESLQAIANYFHKNPLVFSIIQAGLFWLQGILPITWLTNWVLDLWPSVEFDFGPEHKKIEKMRRKRLGLFFSFIIIPLLLDLVYGFVTR